MFSAAADGWVARPRRARWSGGGGPDGPATDRWMAQLQMAPWPSRGRPDGLAADSPSTHTPPHAPMQRTMHIECRGQCACACVAGAAQLPAAGGGRPCGWRELRPSDRLPPQVHPAHIWHPPARGAKDHLLVLPPCRLASSAAMHAAGTAKLIPYRASPAQQRDPILGMALGSIFGCRDEEERDPHPAPLDQPC